MSTCTTIIKLSHKSGSTEQKFAEYCLTVAKMVIEDLGLDCYVCNTNELFCNVKDKQIILNYLFNNEYL